MITLPPPTWLERTTHRSLELGLRLERRFEPAMDDATREARYAAWKRAVEATMAV